MMGKLYDDYIAKPKVRRPIIREGFAGLGNEPSIGRAEFEALRARVTELEKRYQKVTEVTQPVTVTVTRMTPAEKQRAYRERKKHGQTDS